MSAMYLQKTDDFEDGSSIDVENTSSGRHTEIGIGELTSRNE